MKAQQHLDEAAGLVGGDRARQHGDVRLLNDHVAELWTAYLQPRRHRLDQSLDARDVLAMMALLKLARAQHGDYNRDDWVDALGYVALAGQVAEENYEHVTAKMALERRAAEAQVQR